ncbi:hypothetical protein AGMMS49975_18660 [Clostridia bacterium]|nr:hypothetical protein AGMMS49975_18660 [Clostridia bacterium]
MTYYEEVMSEFSAQIDTLLQWNKKYFKQNAALNIFEQGRRNLETAFNLYLQLKSLSEFAEELEDLQTENEKKSKKG